MKKRVLGFLLTAVMAMGLFAGCGPADTGAPADDGTATEAADSGASIPDAQHLERVGASL